MDSRAFNLMLFFNLLSTGFSTEVNAHGDASVAFGKDALFSCLLSDPKGVSQVTWQKVRNNVVEDLATYSTRYGEHVKKSNIIFSKASLNSTSITVKHVSMVDEGCYVCTFHVYPSGSARKQTCLTVNGISNMSTELIPSSTETPQPRVVVSCSATGKPAPEVTLSRNDAQVKRWEVLNEDGTATVSINLTLSAEDLADKYLDCVVKTPGIPGNRTKRIYLSNETNETEQDFKRHHGVVAGVVTILVIIALLVLFIVYHHVAKQEKGYARGFLVRSGCYSVVSSEEESQAAERCLPSFSCLAV